MLQRAFTGNVPFKVHFLCRRKPVLPVLALPSLLGAHPLGCIFYLLPAKADVPGGVLPFTGSAHS